MILEHDHSTINMGRLSLLPEAEIPRTYTLQRDVGNTCFLDPPGHPSYFTQYVYTEKGNIPLRGTQMVLLGHVVKSVSKKIDVSLDKLYIPLPLDHPRVQEWIAAAFRHLRHCYYADEQQRDILVDYSNTSPQDIHVAVVRIRRYYPEFMPTREQIGGKVPPAYSWYERLPRRPEPDECPGEPWRPHPVNVSWCQVCGWKNT